MSTDLKFSLVTTIIVLGAKSQGKRLPLQHLTHNKSVAVRRKNDTERQEGVNGQYANSVRRGILADLDEKGKW